MGSLQTLNLGGVPITTVMPLKELTGLSGLNLYMTNITDFNEIPFIENVSYLGLPDTDLTELPEHISQMKETASDDYFHCNDLKPCTQPAWE
ncbi:hypothetical protein [Saccharospirillum impatiens]|uniref:hypothetical protein n=1 Tax=Saccharospirillum impatiens TaxID=169438 RepID=UPI00048A80C1|nr:hypothetical protein [Saccharospirillum impatiens]